MIVGDLLPASSAPARQRTPLVLLLVANVVSNCGTAMTYLAIPWFVLETTGSAVQTGVTFGMEVTGTVISSLLGGPLVERLGRRRASVWSDVLAAGAVAAIPLLHAAGSLSFLALLGFALLLGLTRAPGETARQAMMPALIKLAGTSLERAASAYDGASRAAKMLGPPLAGVLVATAGAPRVLLIDAATFAVSALLVRFWVPAIPTEVESTEDSKRRGRYLRDLRAGFSFLRRDRLMGAIVLMVMVTNMLDMAVMGVLFPLYSKDVLGSPIALGLITGVFAGGAVAGTVLYSWIGARLPRWPVYTLAFFFVGAPKYLLFIAEPGLAVILPVLALIGVGCGAINPILTVVEYERVPDSMRAMVLGVLAGGVLAASPLGPMLAGFAVDAMGLRWTLVTVAVLYGAATLCPVVFRVWRQLDPPKPGQPAEAATAGSS